MLFIVGVLWSGDADPIPGAQDAIAYLRDQVWFCPFALFNCVT